MNTDNEMKTTNDFTYNPKTKTMSAGIGDLGIELSERLFVKSSVTGRIVFWIFQSIITDNDDDLLGWEYEPVDENVKAERLVIFND